MAAFLLNKCRLLFLVSTQQIGAAKAPKAATSADEEVVCEGEKTREERDAELRGEAVPLDK